MKQINLDQSIKKYWQKKSFKKDELIFKNWDDDFNLYLIKSGKIVIQKDGFDIFILSNWQIIGEKSFLTKKQKPLDAKVIEDSCVYVLSHDTFKDLPLEVKNSLLSELVIFLSERVNKLDTILGFLSVLNENLIWYDIKNNDPILNLVRQVIELQSFLILKNEWDSYYKIFWDIELDQYLFDFINNLIKNKINIKIGKNYVYLNWWDYIYIFNWALKIEEYILHNLFYYSRSMLNYFWEKLENFKNDDLQKSCI